MFPGGLDPDQWERVKNAMQRAVDVYEGAVQNLMLRDENVKRQMELYAAQQQALQNTPGPPEFSVQPEVIRSALETAGDVLNSPEFQRNLTEALQTSEIAAQRLGTEGLIAAQQLAAQRYAAGPGLVQAVSKIQRGQADELLSESAAMAARPEVRETIENADKDEILLAAERRSQGTTDDAELDLEAAAHIEELREYTQLSKEEVKKVYDRVYKLWLLIGTAISAAVVAANPTVSPTSLAAAYAGLSHLLLLLGMQLRAHDDEDK